MTRNRRIRIIGRRHYRLHGKVEAIFDFDAILNGKLPQGLSSEVTEVSGPELISDKLTPRQSIIDVERCSSAGFAILSGPSAARKIAELYGRETDGLLVGYVAPKSSAAAAGLKSDDLVLDVIEVASPEQGADQHDGECSRLTVRIMSPRRGYRSPVS